MLRDGSTTGRRAVFQFGEAVEQLLTLRIGDWLLASIWCDAVRARC